MSGGKTHGIVAGAEAEAETAAPAVAATGEEEGGRATRRQIKAGVVVPQSAAAATVTGAAARGRRSRLMPAGMVETVLEHMLRKQLTTS